MKKFETSVSVYPYHRRVTEPQRRAPPWARRDRLRARDSLWCAGYRALLALHSASRFHHHHIIRKTSTTEQRLPPRITIKTGSEDVICSGAQVTASCLRCIVRHAFIIGIIIITAERHRHCTKASHKGFNNERSYAAWTQRLPATFIRSCIGPLLFLCSKNTF